MATLTIDQNRLGRNLSSLIIPVRGVALVRPHEDAGALGNSWCSSKELWTTGVFLGAAFEAETPRRCVQYGSILFQKVPKHIANHTCP